jgi:Ca2+:H+ antiporter
MSLNWLLVFVPVGIALDWWGANPILVFATSALALVPLANLTESATDALSSYVGPTWGGLLSASLGNAPEIIIGFFALRQGLVEVVKSSLVGSIIGSLLFALGLSMFAGGIKLGTQTFNRRVAGLNAGLLMLAAAGMIVPAVFHHSSPHVTREISVMISGLLLVIYSCSLVYTLTTSKPVMGTKEAVKAKVEPESPPPGGEVGWSRNRSIAVLAVVTIGLAIMSEVLTDAIEPASTMLGLTPVFSGVFLLALVGNLAQIMNAIGFARSDQMDLSLGITVGSSIQVALVVAPVLVLSGLFLGQPMNLIFNRFEIISLFLSILVTRHLITDGESNWLEGLMLLVLYAIFGVAFYHLAPGTAASP